MNQALKTGFKYVVRNRFLTFSSLFAMGVSLFLTIGLAAGFWLTHLTLKSLEARAQITAFFKPETPAEKILAFHQELSRRREVESVDYVSQEAALKIFLGQPQNDPTLLESVSSQILPASLEIKTRRLEFLDKIAAEIKALPEIDDVVYFKDVVRNFSRWAVTLRILGLVFVTLVLAVSLLVVFLSVGVAVKIRAEEIEILRLLGATDRQVALPFLWQGGLYGLAAAGFSLLIFALVLILIWPQLRLILFSLRIDGNVFWSGLAGLALGHFFAGPFLCGLASAFGLRKYLRL